MPGGSVVDPAAALRRLTEICRLSRGVAGGTRAFDIRTINIAGRVIPVSERAPISYDFGILRTFTARAAAPRILVVTPLAGAQSILFRDLVVGLLRHADVAITDWRDARDVPVSCGRFGLEENIAYVAAMIRALGPGTHVLGVCQGAVPALAATALLSDLDPDHAPATLTLLGGPVHPTAAPTRVVAASRAHELAWYDARMMQAVPAGYPGAGRRVYPAATQLSVLGAYIMRHWPSGDIFRKLWADDGENPLSHPFARLVVSLMDLPAELVLDVVEQVFQDERLYCGQMQALGVLIDPGRITRTGLMTVEGGADDIAAPGQTVAAHDLCPRVPSASRRHLLVPDCGHFSLFYGARWRDSVLPAMLEFLSAADSACDRPARRTALR